MRIEPPIKREAREYQMDWYCELRDDHEWVGWLAPPMPKLARDGVLGHYLFRCKDCSQEVLRYPDGHEEWL